MMRAHGTASDDGTADSDSGDSGGGAVQWCPMQWGKSSSSSSSSSGKSSSSGGGGGSSSTKKAKSSGSVLPVLRQLFVLSKPERGRLAVAFGAMLCSSCQAER